MKVLFLDIDGVVCLHEAGVVNWGEGDDDVFDAGCCRRLKEILEKTHCKLVLSSSWRMFKKDVLRMLEQFEPFGIGKKDFIGATSAFGDRGDEIMEFLDRHPKITRFAAVDDEAFNSEKFPPAALVMTREATGITEEIKEMCIRKLNE